MDKDDIVKKYKDELDKKLNKYDELLDEWGDCFFYEKHIEVREKLHESAMECINKILSPELKVFLRNLCSNKLGYPDEVIFYKAFGDEPEVGQSVTKLTLEQKGIDVNEFEKMIDYWAWEGNRVYKQTIEGIDYYYIESLCKRTNIISEEEKERLNVSVKLKKAIIDKVFPDGDFDEYIDLVDILLLGVPPEIIKAKKAKEAAKELLDIIEKEGITVGPHLLKWANETLNS
ncbi:MAG: hypothetical protein J6Y30_01510 [Treponema sp.]|nr:hypothetical protein [Treponema sp.]